MNSGLHHWLELCAVQQDYGWFLALLAWVVAGLGWWRAARNDRNLRWLPWAVAAGVITAVTELSALVTPVTPIPFKSPRLAWDMVLGLAAASQAAGWLMILRSHHGAGRRRSMDWLLAALVLAIGVIRFWQLQSANLALAGIMLAVGGSLVWHHRRERAICTALGLIAAGTALSTFGPVADWLNIPRRQQDISLLGPLAAGLSLGAAVTVLAFLGQQVFGEVSPWLKRRRLVMATVFWLVIGLGLAGGMGWLARRNFEQSALSRVRMAAPLIDTATLAKALTPEFRLENRDTFTRKNGRISNKASSSHLATGILQPLAFKLADIEAINPDMKWAQIFVLREGWLVTCSLSARPDLVQMGQRKPAAVTLQRRAEENDLIAWATRASWVAGPVPMPYDDVIQARAPLVAPDGRMLGWLAFDFNVSDWAASQAQARLMAFTVAGLGGVLMVMAWLQRVRARDQEAARQKAAAAAAANELKTAFLAKVSHELRTPIQSILGYGELLRRSLPKAQDAARLNALCQHGELMIRLVNDLIDLSALEAGAFRLQERAICLADVFSQSAESLRHRAEEKNLAYSYNLDPAVPRWVMADSERFRQVLLNLAGNAIKFTDHGSVVLTLSAEGDDHGHRVILTVTDTGPGIPPAEQGRLFQPFARLDATHHKEGSGLGLALTSALCHSMGGSLRLESDGESGATFFVSLKLNPATAPQDTETKFGTMRDLRILVVDDNTLVRELFVAFLTEQGATCSTATEGEAALSMGIEGNFDVILLDLNLPKLHGLDVARRLRQGHSALRPRIVGVSAHADGAERSRALAAGMDAFLTKPVRLGDLAAVIGQHAGESPAARDPRSIEGFRQKLADQFRQEASAQYASLVEAIVRCDWSAAESRAHYLKNSATVVADEALFSACVAIETATIAADAAAVKSSLAACRQALEPWLKPAPRGESPLPSPSAGELKP